MTAFWIIHVTDKDVMHFFGTWPKRDDAIEWGNRYLAMPDEWKAERRFDWRVAPLTDPDDYAAD